MKPDDLDAVADRVADGTQVAWNTLLESTTADERALLEQLRTLETIARVHRSTVDTRAQPPDGPGASPTPPPGRWAHLELLSRLGEGSHGEVYRAWDPGLEREVALKLLRSSDRRLDRMLVHEARLLARIRHPNVLLVHGARIEDGRVGIWTELVEGQTLDQFIRSAGPLSAEEACLVGATVCRAVNAVHAAGLLHRDIKAQNIMRARGGRIVLMDFGAGGELSADGDRARSLAGTPAYIAPEVLVDGKPATIRSDIYSIGVLLHFLVAGEFPVPGESLKEIRESHVRGARRPLPSYRPDLPDRFSRVVERACAADPAARFDSALSLERALTPGHATPDPPATKTGRRAWRWILAGVAIAAIALAILGFLASADRDPPAFERLTFRHGKVHNARFGPDGGSVIYSASWGRDRPRTYLTTAGARESRPVGPPDATLLAISAGGEMALAREPRFLRGYVEEGLLARMAISGGRPREMVEHVQAADWSPDGRELAVVRDVDGRTQLEFPVGHVLFRSTGWISHPRVARDADAVAFVDHPVLNDDSGRVMLVRRTGETRQLSGDWVSVQGLAWSSDGEEVWFTASRAGNLRAIHAVDLAGHVRLVHRGSTRLRLHDISTDGRALVTTSDERVELFVGGTGAAEANRSWLDWSIVRDLSADGRTLLINESGEAGGEQYAVYLRDVDDGGAVRLGDGSGISLSPDGRWVLASTRDQAPRLILLPTRAGDVQELPATGLRYQHWGGWFPDGKRVLFSARQPGGGSRLFVQSLDPPAAPVPIGDEGITLGSAGAISPDGTRIAAVSPGGRISIYGIDGRLIQDVAGTLPGEVPLQWTPDGTSLYVARRGSVPQSIFLADLRNGSRRLWRDINPAEPTGAQEILRIAVARNGERYAYSLSRELSELYLMTGAR